VGRKERFFKLYLPLFLVFVFLLELWFDVVFAKKLIVKYETGVAVIIGEALFSFILAAVVIVTNTDRSKIIKKDVNAVIVTNICLAWALIAFVIFMTLGLNTKDLGYVQGPKSSIEYCGQVLKDPTMGVDKAGNHYLQYEVLYGDRMDFVRIPLSGSSAYLNAMKHVKADTRIIEKPEIGENLYVYWERVSARSIVFQIGTNGTAWEE